MASAVYACCHFVTRCSVICLKKVLATTENIFMVSNTVCHVAFKEGCYQFIMVFYTYILLCFYPLSYILVPCILVNYNVYTLY